MMTLAALILSFALAGSHNPRYSQTWHQTAPLSAGGELEIDDQYGDVRVEPGLAGTVDVTAVMKANAQEDLAGINIHMDRVPGAVKVSTDFPSSWRGLHHVDRSVDYTVKVPKGTKVVLRLQYGDGVVTDVHGPVDLESKYGDLKVSNAAGTDTLQTKYGDVRLSIGQVDRSGRVVMSTTYGDVDVALPRGASPAVSARTRFGDIRNAFSGGSAAGPSLDLRTTFGDVTVEQGG